MDEWIRYGDMWMGRLYLFGCIGNLFKEMDCLCDLVCWDLSVLFEVPNMGLEPG